MTQPFDQSALLRTADALIGAALKAGADAADAVVVQASAVSASVRLGKIEESEAAQSDDMGLRVFVGKRQAMVSTNITQRNGLGELAERAVAMARAAPEDPYSGLADPDLLAKDWPDLDNLDDHAPDAARLTEMALEAEAAGLDARGITNSGGASASWSLGGLVLATSAGFRGGYLGSGFSVSCSLVAGEGTAMERDYDYAVATHMEDLPEPASIGRGAAERTLRRLRPRKVASRRVPVVYEPRAASSLIGHLIGAISGTAITRKTSFLKDRLGKQVFSSGITIIDDPLRRRGQRSRPFDGEGLPTHAMALIEDGVLRTWLLDCASARELGLKPTGHARRGVGGPPAPGASNLHVQPGASAPDDLIGGIDEGFYVTDLIGAGVNGVTGDYSRGAAGFWIEKGKLAYPVSEVTIASNLRDMYAGLTPASDLEFRYAVNAPTLMVKEMTVAGR